MTSTGNASLGRFAKTSVWSESRGIAAALWRCDVTGRYGITFSRSCHNYSCLPYFVLWRAYVDLISENPKVIFLPAYPLSLEMLPLPLPSPLALREMDGGPDVLAGWQFSPGKPRHANSTSPIVLPLAPLAASDIQININDLAAIV